MSDLAKLDLAHGAKQVKPSSLDELRADLVHPIIRVYVFVGREDEPGWKAGVLACGLLVGINVYLANEMSVLREWVPAGEAKGIVFGTDDQPDRLLNEAEASVTDIVMDANAAAP